MGIRITQMDPLTGAIDRGDLFEIARKTGNSTAATYSVTAEQIADYYKNSNNGSFKGTTTKSLDEFDWTDAGVYYWQGTPALNGMPSSGFLEVMTYASQNDVTGTVAPATFLRLTAPNAESFCRSKIQGLWSSWAVLSNKNGNVIFSGRDTAATITFPAPFEQTPNVFVVPYNSTANKVYVINVGTVTNTGFSVVKFTSDLTAVTTTVTTTQNTETHTTTSQTTETRGAWKTGSEEGSDDFTYYWIATLDG